MTNVPGDIDDLKTLQREAEELRESRRRANANDEKESVRLNDPEDVRGPAQVATDEKETAQTDGGIHDLAEQIEMYMTDLEKAAMERPMLALLAAFSIGIVVGKFFNRR